MQTSLNREAFQYQVHLIVQCVNGLQTKVARLINRSQGTISRWLSANATRYEALIWNTMELLRGIYQVSAMTEALIWQLMCAMRRTYRKKQLFVEDPHINKQLAVQISRGAEVVQEFVTSSADGYTKEEFLTILPKLDELIVESQTSREQITNRLCYLNSCERVELKGKAVCQQI
jgi:hypothetical protein